MSQAIQALFFDVFGTLVDWRSSIAREAEAVLRPLGYALDGLVFADAWRAEYQPALEQVRQGRVPFRKLDVLHRQNLERILPRFGVAPLEQAVAEHLTLAWHRLDAWPDSSRGLQRLKRRFVIAPVSNGNISLMVALARRNGFPWDAVLGAEVAVDFKPKPRVYLSACEALDLRPEQCLMVAAHASDLSAAAACGLRTAFVTRPHEYGPSQGSPAPHDGVDFNVPSLEQLALELGA
jgi:2-haloacid dehalogenase